MCGDSDVAFGFARLTAHDMFNSSVARLLQQRGCIIHALEYRLTQGTVGGHEPGLDRPASVRRGRTKHACIPNGGGRTHRPAQPSSTPCYPRSMAMHTSTQRGAFRYTSRALTGTINANKTTRWWRRKLRWQRTIHADFFFSHHSGVEV